MENLQVIYGEIKDILLKLGLTEHIGGEVGYIKHEDQFMAVFSFKMKDSSSRKKLGKLEGFLSGKNYDCSVDLNEQDVPGVYSLIISAKKGKPCERIEDLRRTLNSFKKDISSYCL